MSKESGKTYEVVKTDDEWKAILTAEQFRVLRQHGTERPFQNAYNANKDAGMYQCAGCRLALFSSEHKYDSRTGWPSFEILSAAAHWFDLNSFPNASPGITFMAE